MAGSTDNNEMRTFSCKRSKRGCRNVTLFDGGVNTTVDHMFRIDARKQLEAINKAAKAPHIATRD